jgi:hypothetical protein
VTPQKQKYLFNDGSGQFGDCHRTCIAMLLNMPRDEVPHFMQSVPYGTPPGDPLQAAAAKAEAEWLAERGLAAVSWGYTGDTPLEDVIAVTVKQTRAPLILGCTSQNDCNHSVVLYDGQIYNPNGGEIKGPMQDGYWWLTAISVGPNFDIYSRPEPLAQD